MRREDDVLPEGWTLCVHELMPWNTLNYYALPQDKRGKRYYVRPDKAPNGFQVNTFDTREEAIAEAWRLAAQWRTR